MALGILSATGWTSRFSFLSWPGLVWTAGWVIVVGSLGILFLRIGVLARDHQSELTVSAVLIIQWLTQSTGGLGSPWMPAYVFLLLATAFSFPLRVNWVAVGSVFVLEGLPLLRSGIPWREALPSLLIWSAGLILIPVLVKNYLRVSIREKDELKEAVSQMKTSAQTIIPPPDIHQKEGLHSLNSDDRLMRAMSLSRRFEEALDNLLEILKASMRPSRHCVLFLVRRSSPQRLRIHRTMGSDVSDIQMETEAVPGRGLIGWIAKEQKPVRLGHLGAHREGFLEYTTAPEKIQSILAVPLLSEGILEGIVMVDSSEEEAFSEEDEQIILLISHQILRALHDMRDRQKVQTKALEFSTLLDISRALSSKLDLGHRLETMADKVQQIIPYDQCFIFLVEDGERRARLAVVRGYEEIKLEGDSVALKDGFVSMIVKNRHPVLFTDLHERRRRFQLFPTGCRIRVSPGSFMGLPMLVEDRVIGVFVIASKKPDAFDGHHMDFLETLCHQAALSVSDAQLHDQVARMAITDSLTGIANHRKFQERLAETSERQARDSGTFSLLMLDVDHFKRINDTFGHPVGDQVLKRLAGILMKMVRKVDTVARYGGEEFALLLPNAGRKEALRLAERIRKAIESSSFETGASQIPVTVSIGLATCPEDAPLRHDLLEQADQALYEAKRTGRNRVCSFNEVRFYSQ